MQDRRFSTTSRDHQNGSRTHAGGGGSVLHPKRSSHSTMRMRKQKAVITYCRREKSSHLGGWSQVTTRRPLAQITWAAELWRNAWLAQAPGFRFLRGSLGKHFRSVTSLTSVGTRKVHGSLCNVSRTTNPTPSHRKNCIERLGSSDPWRRQTDLHGTRFIPDPWSLKILQPGQTAIRRVIFYSFLVFSKEQTVH